jgi:sulfur carrier protein
MNASLEMTIVLNGLPRAVPAGTTVAGLLAQLGVQSHHVAVERNCNVVARAHHDQQVLMPDDQVEIVTLVGGG